MNDPVYEAFLETAAEDVLAVNAASDILQLTPDPAAGTAPHTYNGRLQEVEHLERASDGTAYVSAAMIGFTIHFPAEYCRSTAPDLQFRVVRTHAPLLHPNVQGGIVCLGPHFQPGTRVRPLVYQIYSIISGRISATDHAFDAEACMYYLRHLDQVQALRARPLWRRQVASRVRVERAAGALPKGVEQAHG